MDSSKNKIDKKLLFHPFCQANYVKDIFRKSIIFDTYWEIVRGTEIIRRVLSKAPDVRNVSINNSYSNDYHFMCI